MTLARLSQGIVDPPVLGLHTRLRRLIPEKHGFVVTGEAMPSPPLTKGP